MGPTLQENAEEHMQQVSDITERPDDAVRVRSAALPAGFEYAVEAAAAAEATAAQLEMLAEHREAWRWTLERLLHRTDEDLESVRTLDSPVRDQIVARVKAETGRDRMAKAKMSEGMKKPDAIKAVLSERPDLYKRPK